MNFEDRLNSHLREQNEMLDLSPEGAEAVIQRTRRRAAKRRVGSVGAFVVLAAAGSWFVALAGDGPTTVSTADAEQGDASAAAASPDAATRTSAPWLARGGASTGDPVATVEVEFALGSSLDIVDLTSLDAPSGWSVWSETVFADGGVYYAVSTAPGRPEGRMTEEDYRVNTIYSYDAADGWSHNTINDRSIGNVTAFDGVLYAVSTGSSGGSGPPSLGSSIDRGASWAWSELSFGLELGRHYTLRVAANEAGQLVVASRAPNPDWEQAIEMAIGAGLPVTGENIRNITPTGISYVERTERELLCMQITNEHWGTLEENFFGNGGSADPEADWEAAYRLANEELSAKLVAADCDDVTVCETIVGSIYEELDARVAEAEQADAPIDDGLDRLYEDAQERVKAAFDERAPFCNRLYNREEDEGDYINVTWVELGVTVPESWKGFRAAQIVSGGVASDVGDPWGNGIVTHVSTRGGLFVVNVVDINYDSPTEWTSPDGVAWTEARSASVDGFGQYGVAGDRSFRLWWAENRGAEQQSLQMWVDGAWGRVDLATIAPDLPESYFAQSISSGEGGVVIIAGDWDRSASGSVVLMSRDGVTWSSVQLDAFVTVAIVSDEGAVLLGGDVEPDHPEELRPAPSYFVAFGG